ncbi:MAG: DUF4956 domain-containing protein [Thermoanaerobaculia bacterium]
MIAAFFRSPFVKLTFYYLLLGSLTFGLLAIFPALQSAFSLARLSELSGGGGFLDPGNAAVYQKSMYDPLGSAITTTFAILSSLALLAPVAWVYMITKQRQGYDESVVHTVMILPVPVTGLVIVVQNSLALAFSLAGIVAAVRFRNTLKDTKDAVYIFLAIGTALAAGVQALGVAASTSILFNYLVLVMWQAKIGNIYADQRRRTPRMRLGDVLAGAGSAGAGIGDLTIGDPELLAALAPKDLRDIAAKKSRLVDRVRDSESKKYNGVLVVYTDDPDRCVEELEPVLAAISSGFDFVEAASASDGNTSLVPDLSGPPFK